MRTWCLLIVFLLGLVFRGVDASLDVNHSKKTEKRRLESHLDYSNGWHPRGYDDHYHQYPRHFQGTRTSRDYYGRESSPRFESSNRNPVEGRSGLDLSSAVTQLQNANALSKGKNALATVGGKGHEAFNSIAHGDYTAGMQHGKEAISAAHKALEGYKPYKIGRDFQGPNTALRDYDYDEDWIPRGYDEDVGYYEPRGYEYEGWSSRESSDSEGSSRDSRESNDSEGSSRDSEGSSPDFQEDSREDQSSRYYEDWTSRDFEDLDSSDFDEEDYRDYEDYSSRDYEDWTSRDFEDLDSSDFDEEDSRDYEDYSSRDYEDWTSRDFEDLDSSDLDEEDSRDYEDYSSRDYEDWTSHDSEFQQRADAKKEDGHHCSEDSDCKSSFCQRLGGTTRLEVIDKPKCRPKLEETEHFCLSNKNCVGGRCNKAGTCRKKASVGEGQVCEESNDCKHGRCSVHHCIKEKSMPENNQCHVNKDCIHGRCNGGFCHKKHSVADGHKCHDSDDCSSKKCHKSKCESAKKEGEEKKHKGSKKQAHADKIKAVKATKKAKRKAASKLKHDGLYCKKGEECQSGHCIHRKCQTKKDDKTKSGDRKKSGDKKEEESSSSGVRVNILQTFLSTFIATFIFCAFGP